MRIERHKTGVWVREDGCIYLPKSGRHEAHWTFGSKNGRGYQEVMVSGNRYLVHRLVAETFIPNPENLPTVDHYPNRDKTANMVQNLRWADRKMQNNNRRVCEDSKAKYGVRRCEDMNAYQRARYANDPEFAERERTRKREYMRKHRASLKAKKASQLDLF